LQDVALHGTKDGTGSNLEQSIEPHMSVITLFEYVVSSMDGKEGAEGGTAVKTEHVIGRDHEI